MADNPFKNNIVNRKDGLIEIKLTQGKTTVVDDVPKVCDILVTYRFYANRQNGVWYAVTNVTCSPGAQTMLRLHHFICPKETGKDVDHINGNSLDNRTTNLRLVSHRVNCANRTKLQRNNHTGIAGLHRDETQKRWQITWYDNALKRHDVRFSDFRYGKERAKEIAIERLEAEKSHVFSYLEARKREVSMETDFK